MAPWVPDGVSASVYYPANFGLWPVFDHVTGPVKNSIDLIHVFGEYSDPLSALFVTGDDGVFAVGRNDFGRLGIGDSEEDVIFTPVMIEELCGRGIICFASGSMHTLALTYSGDIYSWGLNLLGPLGNGTILPRDTPGVVLLPKHVKIKAIAARSSYSVAVTTDNKVLHWGDIMFSECSCQNMPCEVIFDAPLYVRQIACSVLHVCLLTDDSKVYMWGRIPADGENNYDTIPASESKLLTAPQHKNIHSIACSRDVTVALNEDGKIYVLQSPNYPNSLDIILEAQDKLPVLEIAGAPYTDSPLVFRMGDEGFIRMYHPYHKSDVSYSDKEENIKSIQCAFQGLATPTVYRRNRIDDLYRARRIQGPIRNIGSVLYNSKEYSDLTVLLRDGEVYVHRLILVAFCEHFKSMLAGSWAKQNESAELDMKRYNPRAYRAFLKYVYTGGLDMMNGEDLIDLYDISKSYLEDDLVRMCAEMFQRVLKPRGVASLYQKASNLNSEELLRLLVEFTSRCLEQVVLSEGFENLDAKLAKKLVINAVKFPKKRL